MKNLFSELVLVMAVCKRVYFYLNGYRRLYLKSDDCRYIIMRSLSSYDLYSHRNIEIQKRMEPNKFCSKARTFPTVLKLNS